MAAKLLQTSNTGSELTSDCRQNCIFPRFAAVNEMLRNVKKRNKKLP